MGAFVLVCVRSLGGKSYGSHQGPKVATCSATLFEKASSRQLHRQAEQGPPKGQPHPTFVGDFRSHHSHHHLYPSGPSLCHRHTCNTDRVRGGGDVCGCVCCSGFRVRVRVRAKVRVRVNPNSLEWTDRETQGSRHPSYP